MLLQNPELDVAKEHVLAILEHQEVPYSPVELIRELRQRGVSDSAARDAIWYLIDRYEIELARDRRLRKVYHESTRAG
ncbi:MAG: hypothetical protein H0V24_05555 [Chloroflexia bacterium]|nr:hypothetical protein [Chloroflexia bacterium]